MYFSFSAFCFSTFIRPNFYYFTILFVILILLIILLKKDPSALTGKPIPKFLRMGSFFVLLLCLFEPVFNFNSASKQWVLVLVDTSRSMAIGERINKVKQILPLLKFKEVHLKEVWGFDKHPYLLSETPKKAGQDSITATGELTNIGNAILETPTPSAYILLSDGINNCGRDPIIIAQQKGVPIYTVKIGDSITCDASISEIDYDKLVYTGDTVLIKVRLNTIGYNHQKLQVLLKENNYILQEKNMLVSQKVGVQKFEPKIKEVEFRIIPKEAGMHFYEIEISELPVANPVGNSVGNPAAGGAAIGGEINKENNKRAFGIKVIKSRIKVCWFADQPSWNFKFAKLELAQEKDIELDWWIKVKEGGWVSKNGIKSATPNFDTRYDIIVLDNFDYPLSEKLMDKGTGIIVIGNADISPFIIGHTVFETNSPIEVVEGVDIFGTRELPPLKEIQLVKGVKGGSKILCRTKDGNPLIVKNGQIIGIAANDVWRWNFEYGIKFWSQLVKLINAQGQTLFVETEPVFEIGERVIFKAQAYLSDGLPNPNEDIKIKVSDNEAISTNSTNIEGHFYSLSNGKYEYAVEFLPPGKYKYSCSTINNSTSNGEFSIISQIELQKIESDYNLLHTIAEVSSGKYVEDIKELDSIAINFTLPQKSKLPFKPSYSYLSLFLIILLLSIEWAYLRK